MVGRGLIAKADGKVAGLAGGVATGKALEQARVTPVYVVNMPGSGIGNKIGSAAGLAGAADTGAVAPKLFSTLRTSAAILAGTPLSTLPIFGSSALATGGGLAAGYGVGTLISKAIEGTRLSDKIGEGVARVLATFGNREAQQALALNRKSTGVRQVIQEKPEQPRSILLAGGRDDALSREINQLALSMNRLDDPVRRAIEAESRPLPAQIGNEIAQAISRTDKAATMNTRVTSDGKARVDSMSSKGLQVNVDSGLLGAAW